MNVHSKDKTKWIAFQRTPKIGIRFSYVCLCGTRVTGPLLSCPLRDCSCMIMRLDRVQYWNYFGSFWWTRYDLAKNLHFAVSKQQHFTTTNFFLRPISWQLITSKQLHYLLTADILNCAWCKIIRQKIFNVCGLMEIWLVNFTTVSR